MADNPSSIRLSLRRLVARIIVEQALLRLICLAQEGGQQQYWHFLGF